VLCVGLSDKLGDFGEVVVAFESERENTVEVALFIFCC